MSIQLLGPMRPHNTPGPERVDTAPRAYTPLLVAAAIAVALACSAHSTRKPSSSYFGTVQVTTHGAEGTFTPTSLEWSGAGRRPPGSPLLLPLLQLLLLSFLLPSSFPMGRLLLQLPASPTCAGLVLLALTAPSGPPLLSPVLLLLLMLSLPALGGLLLLLLPLLPVSGDPIPRPQNAVSLPRIQCPISLAILRASSQTPPSC
mmetsp:Transcript_17240/g.47813  ORF Transcript_17240/g.47813 Transcript_17240/m.47813 type:complete len:203 (-) Transcript_17240:1516-2124(-)